MEQKLMHSDNFDWAKSFLSTQKQITQIWLGDARYGTFMEDTKQATDLVILHNREITVALRVRTYKFINYRKQATMRYDFPNKPHIKSEYQKYLEGFCDYLLICFATPSNHPEQGILSAVCWDLNVFREAMRIGNGISVEILTKRRLRNEKKKPEKQEIYENRHADDSRLIVFDQADFEIAEGLINKPIIYKSYNLHELIKPAITSIIEDDLNAPPQIALPFDSNTDTRLHLDSPTHDRSHPARRTG